MVTGMTLQFHFTVSIKMHGSNEIYRDHPHHLKAKALWCCSTILFYITQHLLGLILTVSALEGCGGLKGTDI